ncbi:MAG: chalcone isomerase family protein [Salegentibacter sp.]|uniref:Chalcone isomerase-like n=1 Tax=Salegentibacter flavus TaxID=287099 RepID=A0A1I4YK67_9FLAO|nr:MULTISPECIES: chalcone isomerase family protein [Salegentibacter]MDR9456132.1 chalcone isomerase family protein [Salegentibacter sp.]SFN38471.1 Chalcone isomerase-like [Salegentibacter flavus]
MKNVILLLFAVFSISIAGAQTEIGGISLPNTLEYGSEELMLNGAGVREKFWMDMYVGGLYLNAKSSNAAEIMKADKPMAIKLHMVSKMITSKRMIDAVNEGFENATNGNTAPISSEIAKFKSFFDEQINQEDVFDIVYIPEDGVTVYKNGNESGNIKGLDFKRALFGIWLSDKPADKDLKKGMLGK